MQNYRSHTCGQLSAKDKDQEVCLTGWVNRRRDHGGVIFIDLRDRYGITQLVFNPEQNAQAHSVADALRHEDVIAVQGKVSLRLEGMVNKNMTTGEIEVYAHELNILSKAKTPPFPINEDSDVSESVRLKYRYLDMRREGLQKHLILRHKLNHALRNFLNEEEFLEIETPILTKATPEGARDYLVPSRVHPGSFYALPQSPQLFKQLLMVSGFDRYYQIARCFRDEDLRADRQPEFTQLDMEISFAHEDLIFNLIEKMMAHVWTNVLNKALPEAQFERMSYVQAMEEYGSDKPDLRWRMPLKNLNAVFENTEFNVFKSVVANQGEIRGLRIPGGNAIARNQVDQLVKMAQDHGAKGMVWVRLKPEGLSSSVEKFLSPEEMQSMGKALGLKEGDLGLLIADKADVSRRVLGVIKKECIARLEIAPEKEHAFVWITDFPMFEYDQEAGRYFSMHHPFTHPKLDEGQELSEKTLDTLKAKAYDLVLNGYEVGGGSIRIHDSKMQAKVFDVLNISEEEAKLKFGFFLEALKYGTPPHGGIAFGLDRLAMILSETSAIRDVIAFPKTQNASDLMCEAPAMVPQESLDELHIVSKGTALLLRNNQNKKSQK
ncbi:MAG TPA: aspartate--tRNA ligase [Oligoflexia bacterium]|nr:aspartate--tRNA ligase [Oligoflexia bacterium]HMR24439.1 aspartate--tRNA ligase [Oligoflexia bacterium]